MNHSSSNREADPLFTPGLPSGYVNSPQNSAPHPAAHESSPGDPSNPQGDADPFVNLSDYTENETTMPNLTDSPHALPQSFSPTQNVGEILDTLNDYRAVLDALESLPADGIPAPPVPHAEPPNADLPPAPVFSPLQSADEIYETLDGFRGILDSIETGADALQDTPQQIDGLLPGAPVFPGSQSTEEIYETLDGYRDILDTLESAAEPTTSQGGEPELIEQVDSTPSESPVFSPAQSTEEIYETLDGFRDILDTLESAAEPATSQGGEPELIEQVDSTPSEAPVFSPSQSTEEIYEALDGFRDILDTLESAAEPAITRDSEDSAPSPNPKVDASPALVNEAKAIHPAVEVIETPPREPSQTGHDQSIAPRQVDSSQAGAKRYSFVAPGLSLDSSTAYWTGDAIFSAGTGPTPRQQPSRESGSEIPAEIDRRDFEVSSSGMIEPIPGTQEFAPDTFDHKTAEQLTRENQPYPPEDVERAPIVRKNTKEVFLAQTGDVISIDGNDGFDHIDLECFDVKHAVFFDQVIKIDDQESSAFEIHHRNIGFAIFAGGVEVDLTVENSQMGTANQE